jgi:hypothetical protein
MDRQVTVPQSKTMLCFGFALLLALLPLTLNAQSVPNGGSITSGQIWTAPQWATAWQSKVDTAQLGVTIPTYPQTAAEIAASVTPVQFQIAPCDVNRYAVNTTPGTTDMSAAFQAAANACVSVYAPGGLYLVGGVTIPNTTGLAIYGDGASSVIVQKATGSVFKWSTSAVVLSLQSIKNLRFNAVNGTAHTINTAGAQGLTLQNLMFSDCPNSFDCIFLNGAASTQAHDNLLSNIQIYIGASTPNAGIELGSLMVDMTISKFWMNGNFNATYCLELDSGASAIALIDSSPYNAKTTDVIAVNNNNFLQFTHDIFGPTATSGGGPNVSITGGSFHEFTGNHFQSATAGQSAVALAGTSAAHFTANIFEALATTQYAVSESAGANFTSIIGGGVVAPGSFTAPIFNLTGAQSSACNMVSSGVGNINCLGAGTGPTKEIAFTITFNGTGAPTSASCLHCGASPAASRTGVGLYTYTHNAAIGASASVTCTMNQPLTASGAFVPVVQTATNSASIAINSVGTTPALTDPSSSVSMSCIAIN